MHCSSLGEFEQGKPVLESIRHRYPHYFILLTFFSPSGYEVRKNDPVADHICYLPMDRPYTTQKFLNIVQPSLVLFVKYEYWFYYLTEIKERDIPLLLISGVFREDQPFFKWYGGFYRKMLECFSHLFVQNESSLSRLAQIGYAHKFINGIIDVNYNKIKRDDIPFLNINEKKKVIKLKKTDIIGYPQLEQLKKLNILVQQ